MKKLFFAIMLMMFLATAAWAKVNINTAGVAELEALPGIGQAKAEAIVKYREANGKFKTPEDLMQVKGVGEKVFEKISGEIETGS